ncbi:MAG: ABC transporter permease [Caldicoprobacterales bacterium]|jgi:ribose/xylose/arabinose/galactoside ABC-type transport system permease subunit|nr:ABC transporter permease [Clostridiales bacterium]
MKAEAVQTNKTGHFLGGISRLTKNYAVVLAIFILAVIFSLASPYFLTYSNLRNIIQQSTTIAIVVIGQAMIVTTANFDLSLGQNVCVTSCVLAWLIKFGGVNPWVAILITLVVGTSVGVFNGVLVSYGKIPAFIVTLGSQMIARGFAKIITQASPIPGMPEEIQFFGRGVIGSSEYGIPISIVIMIGLYVLIMLIMHYTKFGRSLYAIGGGEEAAYFAGINVKKYKAITFTVAGLLCAVSSVILVTRLDSAALTNGYLYEFDAMIACIIGGISLTGGKGTVLQGLFGAIFLTLFFNGMTMLNVDPFVQDVIKGFVLIGAVVIDVFRNKR